MNSKEIVTNFLERKDEHGQVRLTVKQVKWLVGQLGREGALPPVGRNNDLPVQNKLGEYFRLIVYPNGAGFLKPSHNEPSIFQKSVLNSDQVQQYVKIAEDLRAAGNELAAAEIEKSI
jgi:hypothetical protein